MRLPLGNPRTKCYLDMGLVERHIIYYKGEGDGFPPKSKSWWVLWVRCMWLVLAPKVLQLCTNHLVLVLCRFMWVVEACQFFLVPSRSSSTPFCPSKVCKPRSVPRLLTLPFFSIWTYIWVLQGVRSVSVDPPFGPKLQIEIFFPYVNNF